MKIKNRKTIIFILLIAMILLPTFLATRKALSADDQKAEQIISDYIEAKNLGIRPGMKAYTQFLKGILLGEYPDLTGEGEAFLESPQDADWIINYAARYYATSLGQNAYGTEIPEAAGP